MNYSSAAILILGILTACASAYLAKQKNRSPVLWFFIGALFGIFALLALILFPTNKGDEEKQPKDVKVPDVVKINSEAVALPEGSSYPGAPPTLRISRDTTLDWYFIDPNALIVGPLKLNDLRKILLEQKLDNQTFIWCDEFPDWAQIKTLQNGAMLLDPDYL